jgi:hypothetical protein
MLLVVHYTILSWIIQQLLLEAEGAACVNLNAAQQVIA